MATRLESVDDVRARTLAALALLQGLFAVEALVSALMPPETDHAVALDAMVAIALAVLAGLTLFVLRRRSEALVDADIVVTWILLAVFFALRQTREGRILVVVSMVLLAALVAYCRPRSVAIGHLVGMAGALLVATAVNGTEADLMVAAWGAVSIAVTAWIVLSLRSRDRHVRLIVENSGDVVFHTRDGVFQWVSPSARDVLGWRPADLVGVRKIDLWHPDDRPLAISLRERTGDGQTTREEMRFRRPDGTYIWVEATLRPYVDSSGQAGISGSMRDVSERIVAREALAASEREQRDLADRLASALDARARVIQNLSHEFRIPLTVMRAPMQRLARRPDLSDEDRSELDAALRASRRLGRLVDELLVVAQSEAGTSLTVREAVDAAALTTEATEVFRPQCEAAGIELSVTADAIPAPLWLDGEAWARIVTNLVSNAVRFTPRGSIDVRLAYVDPWLDLEVLDSGIGILEAERDAVFDRFQQGSVRAIRGGEGTGIGLSVVQQLVADLDGACGLRSAPGRGTSVWVRVRATAPAAAPRDHRAAVGVPPPPASATAASWAEADESPDHLGTGPVPTDGRA